MYKIYVSPYKTKNGKWSKSLCLYATFRNRLDFDNYYDKLRKENPTWVIQTAYSNYPCLICGGVGIHLRKAHVNSAEK